MNKQNQNEESDEGGSPENTRAPSPEDAKPAAGGSRLPSGFAVFTTFPHLLFIFEFAFGGLVWILIFLSHLPNPLALGWVMFVSVFCFMATTLLTFVYVFHGYKCDDFCITVEAAYHCIATLFYLSASVIEATIIIQNQGKIKQKQYSENIAAVVFSCVVTLLYLVHFVFSLKSWKSFHEEF
ncbi:myelin and lymphocyte protein-like isoform X1 [Hippopotamus amphibius kiboko]|uniref:myelin and lymphocyte protein-like isoform X1 n=1 Tax=Hippopotamus amphibius kiboko TaxID=575201 RepID=UPI00259373E2|nr:myelin and lymphocyte protein-like isoform X1 [Hippopotamus amphibius kiboko]